MEIRKIGVLGAGQMGAGIAQIAASKGYNVVLRDIKQEFCDSALDKIKAGLEKRVAQGKETPASADATLGHLSSTVSLEDLKDCDMVIEAVPEILELKRSTFRDLGQICRSDAILCTNTSSMSVTEITAECTNPERCAGMHFFFPVVAMRLIEIIRGEKTSDAAVDAIKAVSVGMGKTPVLCRTDTPGFIVNRCLFAFMLEAIHCYEAGIASIEDIDTAVKLGLNHPLGPFEMMDMSGLDTFPHVCESLQSLPVTDWSTPASVKQLLADGRLGRKNGHGWHNYE
jgi:3-hydroxybutyryl-CoA dehydrogenase